MNPIILIVCISLFIGAMLGGALPYGILKLVRRGKAFIIWIDGDGRAISHGYFTPQDGKVNVGNKDYLLDGLGKHGGKYSTWIIDKTTGWNYRAPTRAEKFEKPIDKAYTAVLEASNPKSYFKAQRRHRWTDLLTAGEDTKGNWIVPVAILGLVGLIVIIGMLGYVMSRMNPGG